MRRTLFSILAALSLGLWLGGLVMLFVSVSSLFQTYDRTVAGLGATAIFRKFEIYQMILSGFAILGTVLSLDRGRARNIALVLLLFSTAAALAISLGISPRINAMRMAGETDTDTFRRLHGLAMFTYLAVAHLVAAALVTATIGWRSGTSATAPLDRGFPVAPAGSAPVR